LKKRPLAPGQIVELTVERLAQGGRGVARYDGFAVFVPMTAPQEKITARIDTVKKSFATATLLKIIEPSSFRRIAPCPYYGQCGGCNWQHVNYEEQLRQKDALVRHWVKRVNPEAVIESIEPSRSEFRYRSRSQVHVDNHRAGFLKRASHEIVDIDDCLITNEAASLKIRDLKDKSKHGKFEIGLYENGEVYVLDLGRETYRFTQINRDQNSKMIEYVLSQAGRVTSDFIFDLYCGSGNFTIPLAEKFHKTSVVGVEENGAAIESARLASASIKNVTFYADDTAAFLSRQKANLTGSITVLDPPRSGCSEKVIDALLKNPPKLLIYVSCDPATATRDWSRLKNKFSLKRVKPFDMFPQTDHVELIATLTDHVRLD
jgi:23S rRNA (uracil1939-C5)-methyltransferase